MELRTFEQVFATLGHGEVHEAATRKHREIIEELAELQAHEHRAVKGVMTIALNYELDDNGSMVMTAKISSKIPEQRLRKTVLFMSEDKNLATSNPRQPGMFDGIDNINSRIRG